MKPRVARALTPYGPRRLTAASDDGVITFRLEPCLGGVYVEREQVRAGAGAGRVVQSMRFQDDASFIRWCEADRLQYTYPLLYAHLRRSGCAFFATSR